MSVRVSDAQRFILPETPCNKFIVYNKSFEKHQQTRAANGRSGHHLRHR